MSDRTFVDTNVLIYADDRADPVKQQRAREIIQEVILDRIGYVSIQVLQEYFAVATRKLGLAADDARRRVELYARMNVVNLEAVDVLEAIDLHRVHQVSIWDALIIRAALISGCRRLYTEDLQAGFRIENVEVPNPFGVR